MKSEPYKPGLVRGIWPVPPHQLMASRVWWGWVAPIPDSGFALAVSQPAKVHLCPFLHFWSDFRFSAQTGLTRPSVYGKVGVCAFGVIVGG